MLSGFSALRALDPSIASAESSKLFLLSAHVGVAV
jgi:hypothetical protein